MYLQNFNNLTITKNNVKMGYPVYPAASSYTTYAGYLTTCNNIISIIGNKFDNHTAYQSYGLYINACINSSSGSPVLIANNFLSVGGYYGYYGLAYLPGASTSYANFYFNSINYYSPSSSSWAYPFYISASSGVSNQFNVQNNVCASNNTAGNSAGYYGVYFACPNTYFATLDYNDWYQGTNTYYGYFNGTYCSTLSAWQSAAGSPKETHTINQNPNWTLITNTVGVETNLHINNSSLGAGITGTGVTTDIDGQTRGATPFMGADEMSPYDAGISAINTPSTSYCSNGAANINVSIKNFGINTLTSATINYSINGGTPSTYSWTGSLSTSSTQAVTIGTLNQVAPNSYVIKAWTSNINGGQIDGSNLNDTSRLTSAAGLNGTYTINPSGSGSTNFTSFTAAATALSTQGICGPVTFNVSNGTYTEQVTLTSINGASASNRVTFKSASGDSSLVVLQYNATSTNYTLSFNGVSYVTFKKMTIAALNSGNGIAVDFRNIPTNDSLSNCRITTQTVSLTGTANAAIFQQSAAPVSVTISNNVILNGSYGIYWNTNNSATHTEGTTIVGNQFTNQYYMGMYTYYCDGTYFNNNVITSNTAYTSYYGAYMYWTTSLTRSVQVNTNRIYGNMMGYGFYFYYLGVNSSNPTTVSNNMVQMGSTSGASNTVGMYFASSNYQVFCYHNTSVVYGTSASNYGASCNGFVSTPSVFRNNVWANFGNGTTTAGGAFYTTAPGTTYTFDYNDLYVNTGGAIGNLAGTPYTTLNSWKAAVSTNDANTLNVNPLFTSTSDLHASNPSLKAGTSGLVATDFDGQSRASIPCIGADEFPLPSLNASISGVNVGVQTCAGTQNVYVTLKNLGTTALTSCKIDWSINSTPQTQYSWSGNLASGSSAVVTLGTNNYISGTAYTISATSSLPNGGTDAYSGDDNSSGVFQAGLNGVYTINPSGSGSSNYTTFTAAVAALNAYGVCGPVRFNVSNGTYNEKISIGYINNTSSTNTITFASASGDSSLVTLAWPSDGNNVGVVDLSGASYIKFRKMTITRNGASSSYGYVVYLRGGSSYNTFEHCRLIGTSYSGNSANFATVFTPSGSNENYNTFRNNVISNNSYGFYLYGSNSNSTEYMTIDSNNINGMYYEGIYSYYGTNIINKNIIQTFGITNSGAGIDQNWK